MIRSARISTLALVAVLSLGAAACSTGGGPEPIEDPRPSTTAASQPVPDPTDADTVVWQEFTGGGLIPGEQAASEVPDVTIYADGRILVHVTVPGGRPGGPAALDQAQISPAALDAFLADAAATGLIDPDIDFGAPGVTDQPSTTVTLRAGGALSQINVYALDIDHPVDDVSQEQAVRRGELEGLLARARGLADGGEPYVPERVKAVRFDPSAVGDRPASRLAWPGPPMSAFPAPVDGSVQSCLVIEGDDAATVYAAAARQRPETTWDADGELQTIVVVPLIPGQEGCPPA